MAISVVTLVSPLEPQLPLSDNDYLMVLQQPLLYKPLIISTLQGHAHTVFIAWCSLGDLKGIQVRDYKTNDMQPTDEDFLNLNCLPIF